MDEDHVVLLDRAREMASAAAFRYQMNKNILIGYCEVGLETAKLRGRGGTFEIALSDLKKADDRIGYSAIGIEVARLMRRIVNIVTKPPKLNDALLDEDS